MSSSVLAMEAGCAFTELGTILRYTGLSIKLYKNSSNACRRLGCRNVEIYLLIFKRITYDLDTLSSLTLSASTVR